MHDAAQHEDLGDGITVIDSGLERLRFAARYLIESHAAAALFHAAAALFDAGMNHSVPKTTIARLLECAPRAMLLTRYSRVDRPGERAQVLIRLIDAQVRLAREHAGHSDAVVAPTEALHRLYFEEIRWLGSPVAE